MFRQGLLAMLAAMWNNLIGAGKHVRGTEVEANMFDTMHDVGNDNELFDT